jgi:hypothetical protein
MATQFTFRRMVQALKSRWLEKKVTIYPSYGYESAQDPGIWLVPMRVWIHDDRDTPFVEQAFERWALRYFEKDLERPLEHSEKARLERTLQHFIADDKSRETVEFIFADDPHERVFAFSQFSSHNGVIEESIRVPDELVQELYARQSSRGRWLKIRARTTDGSGVGEGVVRFLSPEGLSVISDIDDTVKVTNVPAGKKTVLRNVFLKEFQPAAGMKERYEKLVADAGPGADICFHYVSGSPWQIFGLLHEFLIEEQQFPAGTFHMKNLRKNLFEAGALDSIRAFVLGGDLATLDQKIRQITTLMMHLPRRQFILVGDSGERDPEVYRALQRLFPTQVQRIIIRDVLGERLHGMERIFGDDVAVSLDTSDLEAEMAAMVLQAKGDAPNSPKL